jgi:hypothetical protein
MKGGFLRSLFMTMTAGFIVSVLVLLPVAYAERPFAIENETLLITDFDFAEVSLENELTLEWEYDDVTLGLQNMLAIPELGTDRYEGELSLILGGAIVGPLRFELTQKYIHGGGASNAALNINLILGVELEDMEISIEDENELEVSYASGVWEYTNTLSVEKSLGSLIIIFDNELVVALESGSELEDVVSLEPSIDVGPANIGLKYLITIVPDMAHGLEARTTLEF